METADSLLDKKEAIIRDIEEKSNLLLKEKNKVVPETSEVESGDALDAYMTGLSTQLGKKVCCRATSCNPFPFLLMFAYQLFFSLDYRTQICVSASKFIINNSVAFFVTSLIPIV